ncbi:MAG: hypothetical protein H6811_03450 [Phycisphaeraceae bacterium]|nr:hypothetical protein [Phycisphaeraceae bacterium]
MRGICYSDIGHPLAGEVSLWWMDAQGTITALDRPANGLRAIGAFETAAMDLPSVAYGRVEHGRAIGSVQRRGQTVRALNTMLDGLNARFPGVRWYAFEADQPTPAAA